MISWMNFDKISEIINRKEDRNDKKLYSIIRRFKRW